MGSTFASIDDSLIEWIGKQHLFFTGSAPNDPDGHINVSPKGSMDTFRVLGPTRVAYLDLTGSGIETIAHLKENGRIVIMFVAFEGPPKIVRLHGKGTPVEPGDPRFAELLVEFDPSPKHALMLRSFIEVAVSRISDSCGFVAPKMKYVGERETLYRWAENKASKDEAWSAKYKRANNLASIDGLPGLDLDGALDEIGETETTRYSSAGRAL